MLFKDITILDENLTVRKHCYVGIKENTIDYIGTEEPQESYGETYSGEGKLLMSGFFNVHAHAPMLLMRGYGENRNLNDWLNKLIFPFEDHLDGDSVYWATLLSMAESARFGIVSSSDMYFFCDAMARAVISSGLKMNLARGISEFGEETVETSYRIKEAKELIKQYHGAENGRILVDMSLHAEYTTTPVIVEGVADLTRSLGLRMQVHVSETKAEHQACKERHKGMTPVQYMNHFGVFDSPTTAAHCIWVENEDMDILAEKGVTVASCPVSNLKLASGVLNAPSLMKHGIPIALGTDSVASNNSLNFMEEIKMFALLQKGYWGDLEQVTSDDVLFAATRAGALSQGRTDTGLLAEGYKADLIVMDISGPHMWPQYNLKDTIVYAASGSDVVLTMVDGRIVYRDGAWTAIDVEKARAEVEASRLRILGELASKAQ